MNWLNLIILIIVSLILIEIFKHMIVKKLARIIIILAVVFIAFLLISSFLAKNNIIKTDNKIIQTGAVIVDDVNKNIDKEYLTNLTTTIKQSLNKNLKNLSTIE